MNSTPCSATPRGPGIADTLCEIEAEVDRLISLRARLTDLAAATMGAETSQDKGVAEAFNDTSVIGRLRRARNLLTENLTLVEYQLCRFY